MPDNSIAKVTVVLPARNCAGHLDRCLQIFTADNNGTGTPSRKTGHAQTPALIVVDDGSTDGTAQMVREKWPSVTLLTLPAHTGYAHAANAGLRLVRTEYAFLLRPDLQPGKKCLQRLLQAMEAGAQGGDDSSVFCTVPVRSAPAPGNAGRKPFETVAVPDGCALYRMQALEEIGWFDERHFDGLEAFDLSMRAALYGWRTLQVPGAAVRPWRRDPHTDTFRRQLAAGNAPFVLYKNLPGLQRLLGAPLYMAADAAQAAAFRKEGEAGAWRMARTRGRALRSLERERRTALKDGISVYPENIADASFLGMEEAVRRIYPLFIAQKEPVILSRLPQYLHLQRLLLSAHVHCFKTIVGVQALDGV